MASASSVPVYAPFLRADRYGMFALKPQPFWEQLRLGVMTVLILPLRLFLGITLLFILWVCLRFSLLIPARFRPRYITLCGLFWSRQLLLVLGIWVKRVKPPPSKKNNAVAAGGIVSNHLGWLDVVLHMSTYFPSFAAREGTQKIPLCGFISTCIDCVYVDRDKSGPGGKGVATAIKEYMLATAASPVWRRRPMLLFPEGTTTNGRYLLPFKSGAFLAGVPIQPVILELDPKDPVSPAWESIQIKRHLWLLLCQPVTHITYHELPVYVPSEEEKQDAKLYANNVRDYMLRYSGLAPSEATWETKKEYHAQVLAEWAAAEAAASAARKQGVVQVTATATTVPTEVK